ncbi:MULTISPECIES: GyrI-like domain-containing protein [unclassified Pseudomonas]|uniref:GyrI-like domain-containing protein n=1 Tax=unclassified Pseudomonas TaxID=196821 RepID=UPI000CD003D3|nr:MULTISPECIES: GyrI-like domain-containing protein [unclassified Pseudomonas]POA30917.1 AraC family transcriptional regulator [Pseudomonas sp. GW456-R21]POA67945.1 AraC family transcriptional regulator [Pseudomonas sp. GW460-R15]
MDLKQLDVSPFRVSGLRVRTFNSAEQQAATARIGPMWQRFFAEGLFDKIANKKPDSPAYGVYSSYESDASGAFDVTAGVAVNEAAPGYESIEVQGGQYLVFEAKGPMPGCVIEAWGSIWAYFEANPQVKRRFATDFEAYTGPESVAVHIGIF